jgi:hypothetical protein
MTGPAQVGALPELLLRAVSCPEPEARGSVGRANVPGVGSATVLKRIGRRDFITHIGRGAVVLGAAGCGRGSLAGKPATKYAANLKRLAEWVAGSFVGGRIGLVPNLPTGKTRGGRERKDLRNLYWLQNCNLYAMVALRPYDRALARKIESSYRRWYGAEFADVREKTEHYLTLGRLPDARVPKGWYLRNVVKLKQFDGFSVGTETHEPGKLGRILSDDPRTLLKYGVLRAKLEGDAERASGYFDRAMKLWDGWGFPMPERSGRHSSYRTRNLAYALVAARALGRAIPSAVREAIEKRLWACQDADGGIWTNYEKDGTIAPGCARGRSTGREVTSREPTRRRRQGADVERSRQDDRGRRQTMSPDPEASAGGKNAGAKDAGGEDAGGDGAPSAADQGGSLSEETSPPAAEGGKPRVGPPPGRIAVGGTTVRKRPFVRAAGPSLASALLAAAWDELNLPRARIRSALRRCAGRMRRHPAAAALFWGTLAGATFILYASGMGATRGFLAWAILVAGTVLIAAGGPLALVHAWPVAVVAAVGGAVWGCAALGTGALWLAAAVCAGVMSIYFAAAGLVPLVVAGGLGYLVWSGLSVPAKTGAEPSSTGIVLGAVVFAASAAALIRLRRRLTAPLLAAGWVFVSATAAARLASAVLAGWMPASWLVGLLAGPDWIAAPVAGAAAGAAVLVWPRRGKGVTQALSVPS